MKLYLLALSCLMSVAACDAPPTGDDSLTFRDGVVEVPSIEYAAKVLNNCIFVEMPVDFALDTEDIEPSGMQRFTVRLHSTAPFDMVACLQDAVGP